MTDPSAPLEAKSSQGRETMAERSDDSVDAINTTETASAPDSARASLQNLPDDLVRIILADFHPVQVDRPPDVTPDVNLTTSNEPLLSAMRTCKKLYDVGRRILYRAAIISTARFKGKLQAPGAATAGDRAWQLIGTLRSDQSTADLVFDSRHLDKGFERSRTRTAISGPHGERYDYSLEEAILDVCRFITDAAVTLYSCEQANRVGKLLSYAPHLRSLVIHGPSPSPTPPAFTGGLAGLASNGIGLASAPSAQHRLPF